MAKHHKTRRIEKRRLADLKSHPGQCTFDPLSDAELQALADDISRRGLIHPIEIVPKNQADLPPNTIIKGHQRKQALLLIGITEVEVAVRYDLADASPTTIELELLEDNFDRRQLDELAKVRSAVRIFELCENKGRTLSAWDRVAMRDQLAKRFGLSPRHVNRLLNVALKTPREVQNAVNAKKLSIVAAEKVSFLEAEKRDQIGQRIAAGEDAANVVADSIKPKPKQPKNFPSALATFRKNLLSGMDELTCHIGGKPKWISTESRADLEKVNKFIGRLLKQARRAKRPPSMEQVFAECRKEMAALLRNPTTK